MNDNGGQAFPSSRTYTNDMGEVTSDSEDGMTLRDYFAAKAMTGLLALPDQPGSEPAVAFIGTRPEEAAAWYANRAFTIADAMLKARNA